jgi:pre-mRNA-splicing factor ATP-dependent RNA helicase DHX38/PRP16
MRVPNKGWDETPRARGPGGWGKADDKRRSGGGGGWDQTPRSVKKERGADDDLGMNGKEWEEEQVRLDRDWYNYDDEGAVVGALPCS